MKLLILLAVFACLQASGRGYGQTVTLALSNAPLEKAFKEIKKQTGYSFVFTRSQLRISLPVSCQLRDAELNQVLEKCFYNQPLSYLIRDRYIIVQTKPTTPARIPTPDSAISINGRIINENGEAVPGATIAARKSETATSTNLDGEFLLRLTVKNDILIVTSIGYSRLEIPIDGSSPIVIQLQIASKELDEAVVIAYGKTTRRLNTGSVGRVSAMDIAKQPVSNPIAALEGRIPGLFIVQNNGLPGSNFSVTINGRNSIRNGTDPLYIVDGVPIVSEKITQRGGSYNANNPLNTINPLDIESIEVLKDADATSIYGSRGANGVVIITTKSGRAGKTQVELNTFYGWGKLNRTLDYLNTKQYLQMRHEAFANDGKNPTAANAPDLLLWDTTRYTDLKNLLLGNTAQSSNIQLRLSGGNEYTQFSASGNYYNETTVFPGDFGSTKLSFSLSMNHRSPNKKFQSLIFANYGRDHSIFPSTSLVTAVSLPPNLPPLYDSSGNLNWTEKGGSFSNPLAYLLQTYSGTNERLTANTALSYSLVNGLTAKANLGYNSIEFSETSLTPIKSQNPAYNPKGAANFGNNRFTTWIIEPQLEYSTIIGSGGKLQILAGATWQENKQNSTILTGSGYTNDALLESIAGAGTAIASNGSSEYRYQAFFGRVNFNWQSRYILNITGRRDGSSRFGPGNQFSNFGALGAAWIFSESKGIKDGFPFLSFGKLRGSYGIIGNDLIGDYQFLDTWSNTQYSYQGNPSLYPTRLFNDKYNWERSRKIELGLDVGVLHDRVLFSASWYRSISDNQLIAYSLPAQTGFASIIRNFPGSVRNRAWEFELHVNAIQKSRFKWQSNINLTIPQNRLQSFPGLSNSSFAYNYAVGKPLNASIGYQYLGVDAQQGIYTYKDNNNDGLLNQSDYVYNGTTDPKYYGGLQNVIQFGNWQLDFFITYTKQLGADPMFSGFLLIGSQKNMPVAVLDRWVKPGYQTPFQKYSQDFGSPATIAAFSIFQSGAALTDASYLRLRTMALQYSISQKLLKRLKLDECSFFIKAQNLLTITKFKGADPESQNGIIPTIRMIVTGIHLTL